MISLSTNMVLRKVTLKAVSHKQNTNGTESCGILIDTKRGEEWAGGFGSDRTHQLSKGEEIYVWLYETEKEGKKYFNFRLPSLDAILTKLSNQNGGFTRTATDEEVATLVKQFN